MRQTIHELRRFEGQQICVALSDGSRIDDCALISAGRVGTGTVWVFVNGADVFVRIADVVAVWEATPRPRRSAA